MKYKNRQRGVLPLGEIKQKFRSVTAGSKLQSIFLTQIVLLTEKI
jgi:hypothetical protein